MNMRTNVEVIWGNNLETLEKNINKTICSRQNDGWYLRGTPVTLHSDYSSFYVILTFEKPENDVIANS